MSGKRKHHEPPRTSDIVDRRQFLTSSGVSFLTLGSSAHAETDELVFCPPPGFPPHIPLQKERYRNWSLNLDVPNLWTATARTAQDVMTLANWASNHGYTIRARGLGHNWSPIVVPNGTDRCKVLLVDTTQLRGTPSFHPGPYPTATFGTGTTVEEATKFLEGVDNRGTGSAPGYTFQNMTAPGKLTLGGVLAVGAHGTSVPWLVEEPDLKGCMSNLVVSFEAVVTDPEGANPDEYVLKRFDRGDPESSALLVHLGRAFITEVTLRVLPNFYLQVANWYPPADILFEPPSPSPSDRALTSFLDSYGRVEVIWFPFTLKPWVKTWEVRKERIEPQVPGPYNYPWANNISIPVNQWIKNKLFMTPAATPFFAWFEQALTLSNAPPGAVFNGKSRDLLLYVEESTLRVSEYGYALQLRRDQVQETVHTFINQYVSLLSRYKRYGKYPINGPIDIRFTTLDQVDELGVADALPPALSACNSIDPNDKALDTVCWLDVLTFPGTRHAYQFFEELESWMTSRWGRPGNDIMRPEWSKGWAYTRGGGPWTNHRILTKAIPEHYNQSAGTSTFEWARLTLAKYDRHNIFTNEFLSVLLPR